MALPAQPPLTEAPLLIDIFAVNLVKYRTLGLWR